MQLYAIDQQGEAVNARCAQRRKNYLCFECKGNVRLRSGPHRQPHFYHISPVMACRQHQKGAVHLLLQTFLVNQLPGESRMECPFPSIRRIADVAWHSQKIVFEIQCSSITSEEILARNKDYQKEGWTVVWILHDRRYNQVRLTPAELSLRSSMYYYSDMNQWGKGMIYDQFDQFDGTIRREKMSRLRVDLIGGPRFLPNREQTYPLVLLTERSKNRPFFFSGDLMSLCLEGDASNYLHQASERERKKNKSAFRKILSYLMDLFRRSVMQTYQGFFRAFLERACK